MISSVVSAGPAARAAAYVAYDAYDAGDADDSRCFSNRPAMRIYSRLRDIAGLIQSLQLWNTRDDISLSRTQISKK